MTHVPTLDALDPALPRVTIDYGTAPASLPYVSGAWRLVPDGTRHITITDIQGTHCSYVLPRDLARFQEDLQDNTWALPPDMLQYVSSQSSWPRATS
jgi:hypothetical protein